MRRLRSGIFLVLPVFLAAANLAGGASQPQTSFRLDSARGLAGINTRAEAASYRGRTAVRLIPHVSDAANLETLAILSDTDFKDGTIEADIAGQPLPGIEGARGFIGIAFRVQPGGSKFECFYIRPTNGRAPDQLRRNHSTQYISYPDFPWERLRRENPGQYESYVDLETGAWTRIKIVVKGSQAQLYVNGAQEPCLIVNDLKLGESRGKIALWTTVSTEGYFSNLTVN